jgi:iron complex transport system substrate-binding protein
VIFKWMACVLAIIPVPAGAEVRRAVSLNPCLDVVLLNVADPEQIAALSHFSRDVDGSTIAEAAKAFPFTRESAEEVISFNPDLVLSSRHSSLATRNALRRVSIRTELFSEPQNVAESLVQVRTIAKLLGREQRGEDVVARIEAALADAAPPPDAPRVTALIYQRNGFSTGSGSLVDEMMRRTGFINLAAARYGLKGWNNIPLEHVISDPPQMLLAGEASPNMPTWADRMVRHPALRSIEDRMKRATFPDRLIFCGGPVLILSSQALKAAYHQVVP